MNKEETKANFQKAKDALFVLEESLGKPGNQYRTKVYRLRVELGYIGQSVLDQLEEDEEYEKHQK